MGRGNCKWSEFILKMNRYNQIDLGDNFGINWGMFKDCEGQWMHYSDFYVRDENGEPTDVSWKNLAEKQKEILDFIKDAIKDWNGGGGILSDGPALFAISAIINSIEPTEEDKKRAREIYESELNGGYYEQ